MYEYKLKFICVQIPEILDEKSCSTEAEKQVIRNAINVLTEL